jgi:hypothetical protein
MYGACTVLDLRKHFIGEQDPVDREHFGKIGVTVKKNHAVPNRNPYVKCEYYFEYGRGIEQVIQTIEAAVNQGVIAKSGAFFKDVDAEGNPKVIDGIKYQWQGRDAYRKFCIENPVYFKELQNRVDGNVIQLSSEEIEQIENEMSQIEKDIPEDVIAAAVGEETPSKGKKKK